MGISEIFLIAFGVSVDAAAVSISGSLCPGKYTKRHCAFNAACFFGGFQFFMPLAGFYMAGFFTGTVSRFEHWIAFILLTLVGEKMIWEARHSSSENQSCPLGEFFSVKNLFLPAIATSLDALAIGAGMAFSGVQILIPALTMGIVTALVSGGCVILGKFLAEKKIFDEKTMGTVAGIVIILIGLKLLLQKIGWLPQF